MSTVPKLYSIFQGEVASVQAYGIFVRIPGCKKNGLVHKSQMSSTRIENPEDMVEKGEKVYCKVISADPEGNKIGLSMKVVSQTTGQDQDPNHVQTTLDEQRRRTGFQKEIPRIELGAVLDTTCSKCGGKGHFAKDCFHQPGAKTYDLLPDLDFMAKNQEEDAAALAQKLKKEKKLKKKAKKDKKKKKKYKKHDSSESSDSEIERKKKSKKKKAKKEKETKKKEKKRYRSSSESSSTSASSSSESDSAGQSNRKKVIEQSPNRSEGERSRSKDIQRRKSTSVDKHDRKSRSEDKQNRRSRSKDRQSRRPRSKEREGHRRLESFERSKERLMQQKKYENQERSRHSEYDRNDHRSFSRSPYKSRSEFSREKSSSSRDPPSRRSRSPVNKKREIDMKFGTAAKSDRSKDIGQQRYYDSEERLNKLSRSQKNRYQGTSSSDSD